RTCSVSASGEGTARSIGQAFDLGSRANAFDCTQSRRLASLTRNAPAWRHDHAWRDGVSQEYRSIAPASNARCWCIAARKPGMVSRASGYPLPRARPATSRQPLIYQALAAQ
ncbi:hypothetical protein, partial [Xanthomonas euvesicatoria]|uniref:hypothetical protein n=1 Tax=Xanthomonas euvesicatoria TaxID=456327 RepID=UPI001B80D745